MHASELWGYLVGGVGIAVGLSGWLRSGKGDVATQATWMGAVNAKLDYIASELTKLNDIRERVAVLERDVKTAFRRIDEEKERI
jgi:hypothetical protein